MLRRYCDANRDAPTERRDTALTPGCPEALQLRLMQREYVEAEVGFIVNAAGLPRGQTGAGVVSDLVYAPDHSGIPLGSSRPQGRAAVGDIVATATTAVGEKIDIVDIVVATGGEKIEVYAVHARSGRVETI